MEDSNTINQSRAARLRKIRSLTRLSLSKFCSQNHLTYSTYRLWELGATKLTERNATICCKVFEKYKIYCSTKWLLSGLGNAPHISHSDTKIKPNLNLENLNIHPEITVFSQTSNKTFICRVTNDDAKPYFDKNDFLGCVKVNSLTQLSRLDNYLIKYSNNDTYHIKKICVIDDKVVVMPLSSTGDFEVLNNQEHIEMLAKIVLHRVSCI